MTERRTTGMALQLIVALFLCSCASRSQQSGDGKDITFSGTLQSTPVQLVPASADHSELVALLREEGRIVSLGPDGASELAAPGGCTSPVVLGLGEAGPREAPLLVLDSACGGWIAAPQQDGGWAAQPWADHFPDLVIEGLVPLPDSPEQLATSSGEYLLGTELEGALLFSHFDGKNLRRFRVDVDSGWSFDETVEHF